MTANRRRNYTRLTNPLLQVPTKERKKLLERERRLRRTGNWGPWERIENPNKHASGWLSEVSHAMRNRVFCVLLRDVGCAIHLGVSSLSGDRPSWPEMQRIKNEIAGLDVTAVEVYPPESEVVDGADMYHIWIVSALPFSLHHRHPSQLRTISAAER